MTIICICIAPSPDVCIPPLPPANGSVGGIVRTDEGYEVTFQCHVGLLPTGQFTARCGSDGMWLPDPADVKCSAPLRKFLVTLNCIIFCGCHKLGVLVYYSV